jgi:hypothetical protein
VSRIRTGSVQKVQDCPRRARHSGSARRKLVDADIIDGSEPGIWKLKHRSAPRVWVEKVHVEGRPDREHGEYALGRALWSPKRNRADADDYWAMREVQPGDFIIHLIDDRNIAGVSVAAS